ncbi:NUDIX hydrolase [Massilia sp. erpn]|uniref:NUDIX hydrolase n=1 Tax=Massilia sp. erpn TaxID=2738142 RepID=UPI00210467FE|nr:hypothetical protein [Massilia sp. erpn]UTY57082.1 hypothetical protein HPQ68_07675 [Massilia sp. erpn]
MEPLPLPQMLKPLEQMDLACRQPWVYLVTEKEPEIEFRRVPSDPGGQDIDYIAQREACWASECARLGKNLWNGVVYSTESIHWENTRLIVELGLVEYKDIVFKRVRGAETIADTFSPAAVKRHMFTAVMPVDAEGKVLLGRVGALSIQDPGLLDLVGGSLNTSELDLQTLDSIREFSTLEFVQETGVSLAPKDLRLWSINHDGDCVFFVFKVAYDLQRLSDGFISNGELTELVALDLHAEIAASQRVSKDVLFLKSYLHLAG